MLPTFAYDTSTLTIPIHQLPKTGSITGQLRKTSVVKKNDDENREE